MGNKKNKKKHEIWRFQKDSSDMLKCYVKPFKISLFDNFTSCVIVNNHLKLR